MSTSPTAIILSSLWRPLPDDQPEQTAAFYTENAPLAHSFLSLLTYIALPIAVVMGILNLLLYYNEPWFWQIVLLNLLNVLAFVFLGVGLRWLARPIPLFLATIFICLVATAGIAYVLRDLMAYVIFVVLFNTCLPIIPWPPAVVRTVCLAEAAIYILLNLVGDFVGSSGNLQVFLMVMILGVLVFVVAFHNYILRQRWLAFLAQRHIVSLNEALNQRTADLEEANHELILRNEDLDAFARTVAHDLKTPLGVIHGYAAILQEMLEDDPLDKEEMEDLLGRIERTSLNATDIVQALLLLARVRREAVASQPVAMGEVVGLALERLALLASQAQAEIITPPAWPTAVGYAPWLVEVWVNYLSNALKYGGRPCLVQLGFDEPEPGMVRFWVRDNGRGLTPAEQSQLFTEFNRLGEQKVEGHGLGLTIVQSILAKLHGRVGVESTPGEGSCFYFILPTTH